ncbi:MAG: M50 family metallopeptidase [Acidimicrobiales bacterium]
MTDTSVRPAEAPTPPDKGEVVGFDWKLALLLAGVVALGLLGGASWFIMVMAIVVMIFLHELGHYLTAKWSGMKVTEFFLFFGPKIWSFKRGETEYGIKCIPAGAYVRIIGMSNLETDVAPEDEHRTYRQQSYPKRLLVVSAGSIMHALQALFLLFVAFSFVGIPGNDQLAQRFGGPEPDPTHWVVGHVTHGSAADKAGLEVGDDVLSIDGHDVTVWEDVGKAVAPNPGKTVTVVVDRDGEVHELDAPLTSRAGRAESHEDPDAKYGFLGISEGDETLPTVHPAVIDGFVESGQLTGELMGRTVTGLASFFTGGVDDFAADVADGAKEQPASAPLGAEPPAQAEQNDQRVLSIFGIARLGVDILGDGWFGFLILMATVNIAIGLLNMIPLLPLDGGHAAIATYERLRSRPGRRYMADVSRLLPITYAVFMFMVILGASAIYLDIVDPIT